MVYPYERKTRISHHQALSAQFTGSTAAGTLVVPVAWSPAAYAIGMSMVVSANDTTVTVNLVPYADDAQTKVAGEYQFLLTGAATAASTLTFAATATGTAAWHGVIVPTGDQYGAAAPIMSLHGSRLTMGTTGSTGSFTLTYLAVEL